MKRFSLILLVLLTGTAASLFGEEAFVIDRYTVNMEVLENNSYKVEERIEVNFTADRHGIYRTMPLMFDDLHVKVSKVKVSGQEYKVSEDKDQLNIRIGSADVFVSGKVVYDITYTFAVEADDLPEMDEFNYNVIGLQWDTTIAEADFAITMPKAFDPSKLNCTSGDYGSTDNTGVEWSVDGLTITGKLLAPLANFQGLTVALELEEGYWEGTKKFRQPGWLMDLVLGYPLYVLAVIVSFVLWFLKGRDNKVFPTVQFEAPDGMTPSEIGYVIDGEVDNKDVTSLIVYWAQKGYLEIDAEQNKRGKTEKLTLIKLKDPDKDARSYEKKIFKELFKSGTGDRVTTDDLTNSFYKTVSWGTMNIPSYFTGFKERRVFEKSTGGASFLISLLGYAALAALWLRIFRDVEGNGPLWVFALFIALFQFVFYYVMSKQLTNNGGKNGLPVLIILSLASTAAAGFVAVYVKGIPLVQTIVCLASVFACAFFVSLMSKRTPYGDEILGKVLGFKDFIKEAEADKLKMMFESNPSYFYNILPYAMVLGLSDKWSDHFKDLAVTPPTWYRGGRYDSFNTRDFERDFSRSFGTLAGSMTSAPSSSGSSGSSGSSSSGGFSGGGAGGGGGSSW